MDDSISVMVTGVGAPPGVSILKALRQSSLPLRIITTDADPVSIGLYRADGAYTIPRAGEDIERYIDRIASVCRKEHVRLIFFGSEAEMQAVARRKQELEQRAACVCVLNDAEMVETFTDKWRTVRALESIGIGAPRSALPGEGLEDLVREIGFPLLIKPRFGSGSKNIFKVTNESELRFFTGYVPDPVIQEILEPDEEEYTVGVYKGVRSGAVSTLSFRRAIAAGLTYKAQVVRSAEIEVLAEKFARSFPVWGPFNLQLRVTSAGPKIFEVNLRPSSSVVMRSYFGFNEPDLTIRDVLLEEMPCPQTASTGFALRYWDEIFIEEEDVGRMKRFGSIDERVGEKQDLL